MHRKAEAVNVNKVDFRGKSKTGNHSKCMFGQKRGERERKNPQRIRKED